MSKVLVVIAVLGVLAFLIALIIIGPTLLPKTLKSKFKKWSNRDKKDA